MNFFIVQFNNFVFSNLFTNKSMKITFFSVETSTSSPNKSRIEHFTNKLIQLNIVKKFCVHFYEFNVILEGLDFYYKPEIPKI